MTAALPPRLAEIVADFADCEGPEKLEYLLTFAETLPPLPARLEGKRDEMAPIHECLTPVFLHGELQDGGMIYWFDAPPESPTVRGFAALLMEGVNGTNPAGVLAIPDNFWLETGLQRVLSGQRINGIGTFLRYMQEMAHRALAQDL
jgi:cysteine desulfuration protein SufE